MGGNRKHLAMTITPNKWELDVQGYLNTCNITDATPRKQIRDFSAGVNDLGLWNSMVCWPLRSSQNYGSGTTAFSLGGLGTYNGTLVDGPTWGANGITGNGTSAYIVTEFVSNAISSLTAMTLATVGLNMATSGASQVAMGQFGSSLDSYDLFTHQLSVGRRVAIGDSSEVLTQTTGLLADAMLVGARIDTGLTLNVNGVEVASSTITTTPIKNARRMSLFATNSAFGQPTQADRFAGFVASQHPFFAVFGAGLTSGNSSTLYTLYKSTLGTGLGLP
jgi:hypothetical protein